MLFSAPRQLCGQGRGQFPITLPPLLEWFAPQEARRRRRIVTVTSHYAGYFKGGRVLLPSTTSPPTCTVQPGTFGSVSFYLKIQTL